jgi:hypothetical protein
MESLLAASHTCALFLLLHIDTSPPHLLARQRIISFINHVQEKIENGEFSPGAQWWAISKTAACNKHFPSALSLSSQLGITDESLHSEYGTRGFIRKLSTEFPLLKWGDLKKVKFVTVVQRGSDGYPVPCGAAPTDYMVATSDRVRFLERPMQIQPDASNPPTTPGVGQGAARQQHGYSGNNRSAPHEGIDFKSMMEPLPSTSNKKLDKFFESVTFRHRQRRTQATLER